MAAAGFVEGDPISLQQRLVKIGGPMATHAQRYWLMPAAGHLVRARL
jgi:hypothetical protein